MNLEFQISDWNNYHEIYEEEEEYIIQLFGRTLDDKDVCLKIVDMTPFFYIEIPELWNKIQIDRFIMELKNKNKYFTNDDKSLIDYKIVQKHNFFNFSNKKLFKFIMLIFKSHTGLKNYSNILSRPFKSSLTNKPVLYQKYESNIEPHIRFMHINNLSSCGWVSINLNEAIEIKEYSNCDYSYEINWKKVKPINKDNIMAPFKIMGYDIECISCDHNFPQADRKSDKIIQIGITMYRYGSLKSYDQHLLTLKDCNEIENATVECYNTEKGLLRGFAKKVSELRPDIYSGYNNFGFDDRYIYDRVNRIDKEKADKLNIDVRYLPNKFINEFLEIIGKVNNQYIMKTENIKCSLSSYQIKNLNSSALGDNELKYINVPGIISIDMMKVIQRDYKLVGYKLDNVSANFITEKIQKISNIDDNILIYTNNTKALDINSYIQIMIDDSYSSTPLSEGAKYKVLDITTEDNLKCIKIKINKDLNELNEALNNPLLKVFWTFAKDDMHHTLINKYFKEGDPEKIKQIGVYCLKDCHLVNLLMEKLQIIVNSIGMANVCHVPLSYLFLRGQGVKIFSLVSKKCRERNFLIPVFKKKDSDETYEGATVIDPKPGVYLSPIGVLDYSALYPNSMRERNLSPECYINNKEYLNKPGFIYHEIEIILKNDKGEIIKNIDGTPKKEFNKFAQEIITEEGIEKELKNIDKDLKEIEKSKRYNIVNGQYVKYGILPEILTELLNKRKETNNRLSKEKDPFVKAILNGLQLAFKITANSLYGQTGAPTSAIFFFAIASSTTSIGRERLYYAKKIVEENFKDSEIIYGDTDSIFIDFHLKDLDDNAALIKTIELCQQAAKIINLNSPKPQSIVYEKTFNPLILIAKKKYVGLLFEMDSSKYYLKSMGIVLKRRDNAPIVKIVVGGIIDYILKNRDINKAIKYTKEVLQKLIDAKYPIDKFIISKTLKAKYKKPLSIAHKVLADRMTIRDPGNKPQINDRIPFVYIVKNFNKKKDILQGDLIENPEYVIQNKLKIDYAYYIEHQIINPASQILELMMPIKKVNNIFNKFLILEENKKKGRQNMEKWFENPIKKGSKTSKAPSISLKKIKYKGKTKRIQCQDINKWKCISSEEWDLINC